jgi:hypothetical protein
VRTSVAPYWNWNGNSVFNDKNFPASDSYLSNIDLMTENIHFLFHTSGAAA